MLFFDFLVLIMVLLMGMKWYFTVVLIWFPLMTSDVKHLFICFLGICRYSLEKCLFKSPAHFWIGLLWLLFKWCVLKLTAPYWPSDTLIFTFANCGKGSNPLAGLFKFCSRSYSWTSLVVQWLRLPMQQSRFNPRSGN